MKMWVIHVLIAAVPFYLLVETASAQESGRDDAANVFVQKCDGLGDNANCIHVGDGEGVFPLHDGRIPNAFAWISHGDGDGENHEVVFRWMADDPGTVQWVTSGDADVKVLPGGDGAKHVFVTAIATGDDEGDEVKHKDGDEVKHKLSVMAKSFGGGEKGAFLGVYLAPTSEDEDGETPGARISDVVDDGPAAKAGLQKGDVVLAVNGESVTGGIGALTKILKAYQPGDEVELRINRDGKEQTLSVTLGSRASAAIALALGPMGMGEIEDSVQARGHIVLKNDKGDWEIRDLGDIDSIKDLPKNIQMFVPKTGTRTISITADGEKKVVTVKRTIDGESLTVEQRDDEITVTHVDKDGNETVATYADEDELKKSDEQAYDLFKESKANVAVSDFEGTGDGAFDLHFDIDTDNLQEDLARWRSELDESLGDAREAYERAMD